MNDENQNERDPLSDSQLEEDLGVLAELQSPFGSTYEEKQKVSIFDNIKGKAYKLATWFYGIG